MRETLVIAILAAALGAAPASAATYCVADPACVNEGGISQPDLQTAFLAAEASSGVADRVELGEGTFTGPFATDSSNKIELVGDGPSKTVIALEGTAADDVALEMRDPASSIRGLKVLLGGGVGQVGIYAGGTVSDVEVAATSDAGDQVGVNLFGTAGELNDSTVSMGLGGEGRIGVSIAGGTVRDVASTAPFGLFLAAGAVEGLDATAATPVVKINGGASTLTRSVLRSVPAGDTARTGVLVLGTSQTHSLAVRGVTLVSDGTGNGVHSLAGGGTTTVAVSDTIVHGFAVDLVRQGAGGTANLSVSRSRASTAGVQSTGSGSLTLGLGVTDDDPRFADRAGGDLRLRWDSKLVDFGTPGPLNPSEPAFDSGAQARLVDGDGDGVARRDVGAFEYQRRSPILTAAADRASVPAGTAIQFAAVATDPDPGETPTITWAFDDGDTATGVTVLKAFATTGERTATVTATDPSGETAVAIVKVLVTAAAGGGEGIVPPIVRPLGIRGSLKPRRDRRRPYNFTLRGSVILPTGASKSVCAGGRVLIALTAGGEARFYGAIVGSRCTFKARIRVKKKSRRIRLDLYSLGTPRLQFFGPKRVTARAG